MSHTSSELVGVGGQRADSDGLASARALEEAGLVLHALQRARLLLAAGCSLHSDCLHLIGRLYQKLGNHFSSRRAYTLALDNDPSRPLTLNNLVLLELESLDAEAADHWLRLALDLPSLNEHESDLLTAAACQLRLFQLEPGDALDYTKSQLRRVQSVMTLNNHAACLHKLAQFSSAVRAQQLALDRLLDGFPAAPCGVTTSALLWQSLGTPEASIALQTQLFNLGIYRLCLDPSDHSSLSLILAHYSSSPEFWTNQSRRSTFWSGSSCDDLIIWDDQGYGDTIQNLYWVSEAARRVTRVRLWLRPTLLPLVRERLSLPAHCSLDVMTADSAPWSESVSQLPLYYLPFVLRAWPIPDSAARAPYFNRAQPVTFGRSLRIGLVWSAGHHRAPQPERCARERDVPFLHFWQLALRWKALSGCTLLSLQLQGCEHGLPADAIASGELTQAVESNDWLSTLEHLESLDLFVTVDTSVAHLAGAIGLPTVLLLPCPAEWRWGQDGCHTALYSGMHLARCAQPGDWSQALLEADRWMSRQLDIPTAGSITEYNSRTLPFASQVASNPD